MVEALGIPAVDLFEHVVGQAHAINLPATLSGLLPGAVGDVLVEGFEEPGVHALDGCDGGLVRGVEDAVGVAEEEVAGGTGLAAEFGDAGGDVDVEVAVAVEEARDVGEVLGGTGDVVLWKTVAGWASTRRSWDSMRAS